LGQVNLATEAWMLVADLQSAAFFFNFLPSFTPLRVILYYCIQKGVFSVHTFFEPIVCLDIVEKRKRHS
jgi:hypothetical protein